VYSKALPQKPKLLYKIVSERKPYFRRFRRALTGAAVAILLYLCLTLIPAVYTQFEAAGDLGFLVWQGAALLLAVLIALFIGVMLFNLIFWLRRREETLRFYDQGIVWTRKGEDEKYGWGSIQVYRDGSRGWYIGDRPIVQFGSQRVTLKDGTVLNFTGRYGDLREIARIIRPRAARVTGVQIANTIREELPFRLGRGLTVWPGGVEVDKKEIHWSELDVRVQGQQLTVYQKRSDGKFKALRRYNTRKLDNVGGFMEVATSTIKNHQRERFGV
jgi:hypothetical protein